MLSLLHADAPRQIMGVPQDWPRWAALLPHVPRRRVSRSSPGPTCCM
ncbi:MAG: hypothetical protein ABSA53_26055 [Streptosporangiaceae bacterium]